MLNHAVADKAVTHARHDGCFLDFFTQRHHGSKHVFAGFFTAHHFEQLHDVGGAEEVRANHVLRALGKGCNLVHVERRGVGRQNRARLHHTVQLFENLLFHAHFFEHGFNHHVRVFQVVITECGAEQAHALFVFVLFELAFFNLRFVVFANGGDTTVQRILLHFQHLDGDTGIQKVHRNSAAHGARTNHRDGFDVTFGCVCRHVRNF